MRLIRSTAILLLVSIVILPIFSAAACADGSSATVPERSAYASLEHESSGLEQFAGGGTVPNRLVLPHGLGTGDSATATDATLYSQRQAASPGVEDFVGGELVGLIIVLAVIAAIVIIVWILVPWH